MATKKRVAPPSGERADRIISPSVFPRSERHRDGTPHIASGWDEDEDRRYVEEERALSGGRRRTVFDAADEMDNPGLEDNRDVMSGRDRGVPTHQDVRNAKAAPSGRKESRHRE